MALTVSNSDGTHGSTNPDVFIENGKPKKVTLKTVNIEMGILKKQIQIMQDVLVTLMGASYAFGTENIQHVKDSLLEALNSSNEEE